jgi:ribose transport system permease protein
MTAVKSETNARPAAAPGLIWRRALGVGSTEAVVAVALVLLMVATAIVKPAALSAGNLENVLRAALPLIILAMGQLAVVATAGIDLSVGSVFSLVAMVTGSMLQSGHGAGVAVVAGLATGLVFGLFNGIMIAVFKLAAFVVTLVSLSVAASLAFIVTGGNSVAISDPTFPLIYSGTPLGISNAYLIAFGLVILVQLFLTFAVPGRWVYAIGSNAKAAGLVGVPVRATTIAVYTFSGLCAALASILTLAYLYNAEVTSGNGLELSAIAAVVIGGASLFGGRGTAIGALLGTLIITAIQNVVNLLGINTFWQGTVTGVVILIAVLADRATTAARFRFPNPFRRREAPVSAQGGAK